MTPHEHALSVHEPLLVNLLGHLAGALVFGIFISLLLRGRAAARLPLAAAALALVWNLGSLLILASRDPAALLPQVVVSITSSALSILPAVLFDLALAGRLRPLVQAGYLLSAATVALHWSEWVLEVAEIHRTTLQLTAYGFAALTIASVVALLKNRPRRLSSRALGSMALFLFALSFAHFHTAGAESSWPAELLVHHAGVPLALFVLLQDLRFVLLDAFLRFLANVLLAAGFVYAAARGASAAGWAPWATLEPPEQALLAVAACTLLVGFALSRNWVQRLLTRLVFRRPGLERALEEVRRRGAAAGDEAEFLDWAERFLGQYLEAVPAPPPAAPVRLETTGNAVVCPLRFSGAEVRWLSYGPRRGGRRYLSEDLDALARLAAEVVEQVQRQRESELRSLMAQAELRALQSQIHPHFLFNALNTLYGLIPRGADGARRTVLNLSDMLRYFLRSEQALLPFEEELRIVNAYLEIETLRLGDKLRVELEVAAEALAVPIPVLAVQPLVENAVRHGIAPLAHGGTVTLSARVSEGGLQVVVRDTGAGFDAARGTAGAGVALENVRRRLELCYSGAARLEIGSSADGATVTLSMPLRPAAAGVRMG
jgi:hypothetical protein